MTSELSQEAPIEPPINKLSLEQTHEKILVHQHTISMGRKIIIGCLALMIISVTFTLFAVVEKRNKTKKVQNMRNQPVYVAHARNLAATGNEDALIWLAMSGNASNMEHRKIEALAFNTDNPQVIEALLKSDATLKKENPEFKGLDHSEIKELKAKGMQLGSVKLIEENYTEVAK